MKSDGNRRALGHHRVFLCMGEETTLFLDELLSMWAGRAKLSRGEVLSLVFEASSAIKSAAWRGEKTPSVSRWPFFKPKLRLERETWLGFSCAERSNAGNPLPQPCWGGDERSEKI